MAEYIEREALMKYADTQPGGLISNKSIQFFQAANVAPVRHGRWVTHSDRSDSLICSVCNCGFDMWKHDPHNYCPNCGADMDGDYNG